ncbi:hypothetical protein Tco_0367015 [Tanacetum coccineum]
MESLNFNSQERELHQLKQMQDKAKESCMISFRLLHSHLKKSNLIEKNFKKLNPLSFLEYTRTEIQQFRDTLIQHMESVKKSIDERAQHKRENNRRVNDRVMQSKEGKVDSSTALDAGLVVTESNETESERHVSNSRSGKDTHAEDAEINSVDKNTILDSTNMCHRGGEIEQNAEKCQVSCPLLDPSFDNMTTEFSNQSLESENIFLKKTVAQLQKDLSRMEAHCVNMELKYQNQALKDGQHGQILNETSNKAKINKEIEVLEKINIELEHSVAKLLADNEKLHKENEHLKQTYKDLYDSIKTTRVQTKDHNDSLIAQINSKTVENADLKAQIQEKVFANVALKNKLRKFKGNSVDTKFAKPSILGKLVLQPPRNQSVVRQPNAFKSKRLTFQTWNSSKESYGSIDMAHNYYLEEAKKKTQDKNRNLKPRKMLSAKTHNTPNACTFCNPEKERLRVCLLKKVIYQKPRVLGIYAPFLKEKKGVRFSALYLQKKRNLLTRFKLINSSNMISNLLISTVETTRGKGVLMLHDIRHGSFETLEWRLARNSESTQERIAGLGGRWLVHRYSNPMIQPESEDLPSIKVKEFQRSLRHSDTECLSQSDEVLKLKNFKIDAALKLFKSTNQERFDTSVGNPVKKILLKLNLPNHKILKDRGEALKLKNLKKDALLKLFKFTYQERYEHVGSKVTSLQDEVNERYEVYELRTKDKA